MAPRKRLNGPDWLPLRCYLGKSAFEYRPKAGGCVRLGSLATDRAIIMARYNEAVSLHTEKTGDFSGLVRAYFGGANYKRLAPRTKRDYLGYADRVLRVFSKVNSKRIIRK